MSNFSFTQFGTLSTDLLPAAQGKLINIGTNGLPGSTTIVNIGSTGDTGVTVNLCGNQLVSNGVPQYGSSNNGVFNNPTLNNAILTSSSATITGGSITGTTLTEVDNAFTIVNAADSTKKVTFSASGVTTGTTSTITIPGVSGTLAILNAVQTFTATQNINAALNTTGTTSLATGTGATTNIGSSAISSTTNIGGSAGGSTLSINATTTSTGNITAPVFVSNIATGTAPFTVTSTTPVTNLSIGGNAATATTATTSTTVTAASQPNITSVGTLTSLNTTGSDTAGSFIANKNITGALSAGAFSYGTLGYTDTNIFESYTSSVNSYNQNIIQNTSAGTTASTDYVVSNNLGTSSAYYGDFGINSSGFTGTGSLNAPSMVYLTSTSGDLAIGTTTSNPIHFVVNSGATDAMTISTTGTISAPFGITSPTISGKNVLINGDMSISQINGGAAVTPTGASYILDQWVQYPTQPSKLTYQQVVTSLNSLGAPVALKITTALAFTSAATDYFQIIQPIEGSNFDRFFYGSANAQLSSLQFKANASVAGTYSGAISNYATNRSYVFTFTLVANTDTLVTIQNIPGDTGGTWVGASPLGAAVIRFDLGSGSNFKTSTLNAWQTGYYIGATGAVSLVATLGATLAISEVQFELGPVCTTYERKLISQSLAECQRYLVLFNQTFAGQCGSGTLNFTIPTGTTMRATPTATNAAGGSGSGYASYYNSTLSSSLVVANNITATNVSDAGVSISYAYGGAVIYSPCTISITGTFSAQL